MVPPLTLTVNHVSLFPRSARRVPAYPLIVIVLVALSAGKLNHISLAVNSGMGVGVLVGAFVGVGAFFVGSFVTGFVVGFVVGAL